MLREIRKKMVILGNRMPFSDEVKSYLARIERHDFIVNNMVMEGSVLTREQIETLCEGSFFLNAPIGEHLMVENLSATLDKLYTYTDIGKFPGQRLVGEIYGCISGEAANLPYRKRTMAVTELEFTPQLPANIPEAMEKFGRFFAQAFDASAGSEECFTYAAKLHCGIIDIFPYGNYDKLLGRVLAAYYLVAKGYPAVMPEMKEQDYNQKLVEYIKTGDVSWYAEALKRAVFERLELMIRLTDY